MCLSLILSVNCDFIRCWIRLQCEQAMRLFWYIQNGAFSVRCIFVWVWRNGCHLKNNLQNRTDKIK